MNFENKFIEACKEGNLENVKKFIKIGDKLYYTKNWALHWASSKGHLEVVQYLIENKMSGFDDKNQALKWACTRGRLRVVQYLVEKGADMTYKNNLPLYLASQNRHFDVVKFLVSKGGNPNVCTEEHQQLLFQYKIWKRWRRFTVRKWATRLLQVFYHPDSVGGQIDRIGILKELKN